MNQVRLKQLLDYDPQTGIFTWKVSRGSCAKGTKANFLHSSGYVEIRVDGHLYKAHRLAYLWMNGKFPDDQLDHINGDRSDNRWENLREATNAENTQNRKTRNTSTTGYTGVSFHKASNKYTARITVNQKTVNLGLYDNPETAYQVYLKAKSNYHTFQPIPR